MIFAPLSPPVMVLLAGLSSCPTPQKVDTEVIFKKTEPVYIRSLDTAALARLKGTPKRHDLKTLGLTSVSIKYTFQGYFRHTKENKSACMIVTKAAMNIAYEPKVYLASDYSQSRCSADTILAHEKKHVAADLRVTEAFLLRLKKEIRKAASSIGIVGPFPARMVESEQDRLTKQIVAAIKPVQQAFADERNRLHEEIDAPENIRRDMASCRKNR